MKPGIRLRPAALTAMPGLRRDKQAPDYAVINKPRATLSKYTIQPMNPSSSAGPFFLITIDTEGDNLWTQPAEITTHNAKYLPRFQHLCEQFGLKPTYLTNYEMAVSPGFIEFGRDIIQRGAGEIGMHLHAWNSPPPHSLTENDNRHQPFLIQYPVEIMDLKIKAMTDLLEETFQVKMVSHRSGRWSFNSDYAKLLVKHGYRADCSVTPFISWADIPGDPSQAGGTDFRHFPDYSYYVDLENIHLPGNSPLLEVPMTVMTRFRTIRRRIPSSWASHFPLCPLLNRISPVYWLRPDGRNLRSLIHIVKKAAGEKRDYLEFMLHSSELMPGANPTFRTAESIDRLFEDLHALFKAVVAAGFSGATLADYVEAVQRKAMKPGACS